MSLVDVWENQKAKEAEAQIDGARVEVLQKFAEYAAEQLEKEFPGQWTQDDQLKLASELINMAVKEEEEEEKVAEIQAAAKIFANEVWNELEKRSAENQETR